MSTPSAPIPVETVAALRHQLRTPLNHIVGYAEMLLEEGSELDAAARTELSGIRASAREIVSLLNSILPASGPVRDVDVEQLRTALSDPVASIVRSIGNVAQGVPSASLLDLLRINVAAGELLAFAEGTTTLQHPASRPSRPAGRRPVAAPGYLLVVDDNEANRDMLCRQLERQGHTVDLAEDGPDALRQIADRPFDLVLLDMLMPGMDGIAVLEAIKSNAKHQNLGVLMISALDELSQVADCLQAGADDYLMKPFEPVLLQARITASLERKRLRDREQERSRELERANEELQQFAHIASHDLQEPLRTMGVYAQLLTRRWQDRMDADSEQFLNFIVDAARRMQALVDDVLAFSNVGRVAKTLREPVNLEEVMRQVCANLQLAIAETGASVTHDALPVVHGTEMTPLLQNLIGNAIKYRKPGTQPQVHVSAVRQDEMWTISVMDNGIGIGPEHAEEVFAPFKRLHGREIPGTGIGLALCRRIVEGQGGRIWVEPRPEGGSIFRFTMPVEIAARQA